MKRLVAFSRKGRRHIPIVVLGLLLGVTIAGSEPAHGLARLGDVASRATFGNQLAVQRPTSTTSGDLLVASIDARLSGADSIVPPNGWSLIRRDSNAPPYAPLSQALYYKVAGSSEPASYSWTLGLVGLRGGIDRGRAWNRCVHAGRLAQRRIHSRRAVFRRTVDHDHRGW